MNSSTKATYKSARSTLSATWRRRLGLGLACCAVGLAGFAIDSPAQASENVGQSQLRIVDGQPATEGEIQATVALLDPQGQQPFCTGTLVAPRVVVTAAHCVTVENGDKADPASPEQIAVGAGMLNAKQTPKDKIYAVSKVVPHPSYPNYDQTNDPTGMLHYHDIAVLVLSQPVEGMKPAPVLPLSQFDNVLKEGTPVTITGYGLIGLSDDASFGVLYTAQTPFQRRTDSEFLAGRKGQPDSCNGDSGGPAYVSHEGRTFLIGATSRATDDANLACGEGGIYSLVPAFEDWIKASADGLYPPAAPQSNGQNEDSPARAADDDDEGGGCSATGNRDASGWLGAWLLALGLAFAHRGHSKRA